MGTAPPPSQFGGPDPSPLPGGGRPTAARLKQRVREVSRTVGSVHATGCLIKDLRMGLVDFYSIVNGEPVYLCWQYGEQRIAHFHGIADGFTCRTPLPGEQSDGVLCN